MYVVDIATYYSEHALQTLSKSIVNHVLQLRTIITIRCTWQPVSSQGALQFLEVPWQDVQSVHCMQRRSPTWAIAHGCTVHKIMGGLLFFSGFCWQTVKEIHSNTLQIYNTCEIKISCFNSGDFDLYFIMDFMYRYLKFVYWSSTDSHKLCMCLYLPKC